MSTTEKPVDMVSVTGRNLTESAQVLQPFADSAFKAARHFMTLFAENQALEHTAGKFLLAFLRETGVLEQHRRTARSA